MAVYEFKLPDLGEGIHEGEIVEWHVQAGETVAEDAPLVDVLTDKATVTIPSPATGVLTRQGGPVGAVIRVGEVLAVIEPAGLGAVPSASPPPSAALAGAGREGSSAGTPEAATPEAVPAGESGEKVAAAPATRRLARELGIDLRRVPATGPGGRVTAEDVRQFAEQGKGRAAAVTPEPGPAPAAEASYSEPAFQEAPSAAGAFPLLAIEPLPDFAAEGPVEREPLRGIRRKTARKMVTAALLVPHVNHFDEADVTALEEFRRRHKERLAHSSGPPLSLLPFVALAVVRALRAHPKLNASIDLAREEIVLKRYINLGVAVDSSRGLVVPVVRGADRLTVHELAAAIDRLAAAARADQLTAQDLRGGTFTLTNIGAIGGVFATPIVNYPEVAILALGRAEEKPVAQAGQVVVRRRLPLVLAFDHRLIDGADAARFVNDIVRALSDPEALLLGG